MIGVRGACLVLYSLLVLCRIPRILTAGRFWAEEGKVFYGNACHHPWYWAVFAPYAGYLNM
jgi:hypothetical protein